jgi:hypothetical protein
VLAAALNEHHANLGRDVLADLVPEVDDIRLVFRWCVPLAVIRWS